MIDRLRLLGWAIGLLLLLPGAARADDVHDVGRSLYLRYCSACHGEKGKGDGVVSGLMNPKPTDLTQLAKRDDGKFPFQTVAKTIDGRETIRAHGSPDMPVWGEILTKNEVGAHGSQNMTRTKVASITGYLQSIQEK